MFWRKARKAAEPPALVPVLETFNPGDVAFVKSLLDGEGIPYFVDAERFNQARGFALPMRFFVRAEDAERAREILADVDLTYAMAGDPSRIAPPDKPESEELDTPTPTAEEPESPGRPEHK
ncbi:MAG: DUF2007 domain-containing protein [Chitinophagales bacterium]